MKCICIADIHIQGGEDSTESKALDLVLDYITSETIDMVFIPGDIFEAVSNPEQRLVFHHFLDTLKSLNTKTVVLRGNHDQPLDLMIYEDLENEIFVTEKPDIWEIDTHRRMFDPSGQKLQVLAIPHFNAGAIALKSESLDETSDTANSLFDDILQDYANKVRSHNGPSIVLFHGTIDGARLDNGMIPRNNGIRLNYTLLKMIPTLVIGGHYHAMQNVVANGDESSNIWYPGSLTQQTFGEMDDKGFLRFDWLGDKWSSPEFIKIETTRRVLVEATYNKEDGWDFKNPTETDKFVSIEDPSVFIGALVRFRFWYEQQDAALLDFTVPETLFQHAKQWVKDPKPVIRSTARCAEIGKSENIEESLKLFMKLHGKDDIAPDVIQEYKLVKDKHDYIYATA